MQSGDMVNRLAMARQSSKFKKMGDALYEAWINILLSSPVTHVKNVTGAFTSDNKFLTKPTDYLSTFSSLSSL